MRAIDLHRDFPTFTSAADLVKRWDQAHRKHLWHCLKRTFGVFVVLIAIVAAGGVAAWNHQRCLGISTSHQRMGGCLYITAETTSDREISEALRPVVRWHRAMQERYRRAASQPWLLMLPDPVKPSPEGSSDDAHSVPLRGDAPPATRTDRRAGALPCKMV